MRDRRRHQRRCRSRFEPRGRAGDGPSDAPASRLTPTWVDGGRIEGGSPLAKVRAVASLCFAREPSSRGVSEWRRAGCLAPPAGAQAREDLAAPLVREGDERLGHVGRGREARVEIALQRAVHHRREGFGRSGRMRASGSGSVVKILKRISVYSPDSAV